MSAERATTCLDFERRFDGFLDGELDALSMRSMALHASHCDACGDALEHGELLQELIAEAVGAEVAKIDASRLWSTIESLLEHPRPAWRDRLERLRLALAPRDEGDFGRWSRPLPALAMTGALAALLAALLWPGGAPNAPTEMASNLSAPDPGSSNQAQIERIESSAPHVAVWSEPESHTTAIWVASYEPEAAP